MEIENKRLYYVANTLMQRCNNPKNTKYHRYGGRGIKCLLGNTLKEVYRNLLKIEGYKEGLQIDRIDNNGHYELGNLRWVDRVTNSHNREISKIENILSKTHTRENFKKYCVRRNMDINDFKEVFSGEYYVYKFKDKLKRKRLYKYEKRS